MDDDWNTAFDIEKKQFLLAIFSLSGAAATWAFMVSSFFRGGGFVAPAWFIAISSGLSMFHAGLVLAYRHCGRDITYTTLLKTMFATVAFGVPLFASYYVPWWVWSYESGGFKPAALLILVGLINCVLLTFWMSSLLNERYGLFWDSKPSLVVVFISLLIGGLIVGWIVYRLAVCKWDELSDFGLFSQCVLLPTLGAS